MCVCVCVCACVCVCVCMCVCVSKPGLSPHMTTPSLMSRLSHGFSPSVTRHTGSAQQRVRRKGVGVILWLHTGTLQQVDHGSVAVGVRYISGSVSEIAHYLNVGMCVQEGLDEAGVAETGCVE